MVDDLNNFILNLNKKKNTQFSVKYYIFKYDDHDTAFPEALTQGLEYIHGNT